MNGMEVHADRISRCAAVLDKIKTCRAEVISLYHCGKRIFTIVAWMLERYRSNLAITKLSIWQQDKEIYKLFIRIDLFMRVCV